MVKERYLKLLYITDICIGLFCPPVSLVDDNEKSWYTSTIAPKELVLVVTGTSTTLFQSGLFASHAAVFAITVV